MYKKILLLGWVTLLSYNLSAQFQTAENKLNPAVISQIKEYGLYLKKFSKDHQISKYVIAASHRPSPTGDVYMVSAIFYPFQVDQYSPSSMIVIDRMPVLINEYTTDIKNEKLIEHIDSLYFKNDGRQFINGRISAQSGPDSLTVSGKRDQKILKISKDSTYVLDTGNSRFVDVLPRHWTLEFNHGLLVRKTISKNEVRQQ